MTHWEYEIASDNSEVRIYGKDGTEINNSPVLLDEAGSVMPDDVMPAIEQELKDEIERADNAGERLLSPYAIDIIIVLSNPSGSLEGRE